MGWKDCISDKRTGDQRPSQNARTQYQRDYDRLIFYSGFRRLQNKTQVFPLPGNAFVHNRLTHSLEVASVGRTLGHLAGEIIADLPEIRELPEVQAFYQYQLSSVIAAGCLAHDVGNPPFGHSGEKAISHFFESNATSAIEGRSLQDYFDQRSWADLVNFEGNANAFHCLTTDYHGKSKGGQQLTYTTLASILKYPCEATMVHPKIKHRKKYGVFQADKEVFLDVVRATGMLDESTEEGLIFRRHPFVYLVEAADDICYRIIDMEDAHRLGIIRTQEVIDIFWDVIAELEPNRQELDRFHRTLFSLEDANEKISYLRAKVINTLVGASMEVFRTHLSEIAVGQLDHGLVDIIDQRSIALATANAISVEKIYQTRSVIEVEMAGYHVLSSLLEIFVPAVLKEKPTAMDKRARLLIPAQYHTSPDFDPYTRCLNVVDFIAGMTDGYATELYRKMKGIDITQHR